MLIDDLVELGELVRGRRIELELSQTELAAQVGTTRQWISRIEKGKHDVSTARLFTLLDALELNLDIRRPRPSAGTVAIALANEQSMVPAAALKAIRELPMQAPVTDRSNVDFTRNLARILENNARLNESERPDATA